MSTVRSFGSRRQGGGCCPGIVLRQTRTKVSTNTMHLQEFSPDTLPGSFTQDLVESKTWLCSELAEVTDHIPRLVVLGSWMSNLAWVILDTQIINPDEIVNVEIDADALAQGRHLVRDRRVRHLLGDGNKFRFREGDVVVNTSLNDWQGSGWWDHIPAGTIVVLQDRDNDADILDQCPCQEVLYEGHRALKDPETSYVRDMVIARK
jgi:hypothetical protein